MPPCAATSNLLNLAVDHKAVADVVARRDCPTIDDRILSTHLLRPSLLLHLLKE
jgi:hypothetical protein